MGSHKEFFIGIGERGPTHWPGRLIETVGGWLFRVDDSNAVECGWQITKRHGGLGRTYRDPRFDTLERVAGACSPLWPEQLKAFGWQLITPNRFRAALYQARIQNRSGMRPVIVRVTVEPFGERVRLWCPAGTSAADLEAAREVLRAACWAADIRVTRDEERAQMVTVDVIRRRDDAAPGD